MSNSREPTVSYSLETIYDALGNHRRRLVMHHLRSTPDGVSSFDAVKNQVVEWERETDRGIDSSDLERRLAANLHHVHLPKLEEYGIIEYDWRSKAIRYRPGDVLEAHLDLAAERDFDD